MKFTFAATFWACLLVSAGCATPQGSVSPGAADAAHNARNSLDWAGTYEGTFPCADCPGVEATLTISAQGEYGLLLVHPDRQTKPDVERGTFEWLADNTRIRLGQAGGYVLFVTEGRVVLLTEDEARPDWSRADLYSLQKTESP